MTGQATPRHPEPSPWPQLADCPATPASMTALCTVHAAALTGAQLVDAVVCSEKAISLLIGVQARLLAALAAPFVAGDPMGLAAKLARRANLTGGADCDQNVQAMVPEAAQSLAAGEIAAALRIAPVTAGVRVRDAIHLTEEFTPARQALEDGILDRGKLRAIVEQVEVVPSEQIGPILDQVLPEVTDRCTSEIREIAAQAVITADPDGAADRHRQAAARRDLTVTPGTDAMATLKAFLPADGAVKIFQVSDLLATGTAGVPGDGRGIGARRVDALVDLADRLLSDGHIDLTGFIGQPLPDPTDPTHRPRRASHTQAGDPSTANPSTDPTDAGGAVARIAASDNPTGGTSDVCDGPTTDSVMTDPEHPADPDPAGRFTPVGAADDSPTLVIGCGSPAAGTTNDALADPAATARATASDATASDATPRGETPCRPDDAGAIGDAGSAGDVLAAGVTGDVDTGAPAHVPTVAGSADRDTAGAASAADHTAATESAPYAGASIDSSIPAGPADIPASQADVPASPADPTAARPTDASSVDAPTTDAPTDTRDAADRPVEPVCTCGRSDQDRPNPLTGRSNGRVLTRQGRRPHLTVTLSLDTLAGLNDLPAVLAGFGSIPADLARSIAASAGTITAALTDPTTGAVTAAGELIYRPRQTVRDQAAARTDTCQFPSCRQPVWRCDLDHRDPFDHRHPDQGGRTTVCNCGALCRRHHLFKTHAEWQLAVDTSQLIINWTSPTGHTYTRRPRQTAPPATWIRTGASTIAQRLDDLAAMHTAHTGNDPATATATADPACSTATATAIDSATADPTTSTASASIRTETLEDRLTDAVLRHVLTNPERLDYDPTPSHGTTDAGVSTTEPTAPVDPNGPRADPDADEIDDPPPF